MLRTCSELGPKFGTMAGHVVAVTVIQCVLDVRFRVASNAKYLATNISKICSRSVMTLSHQPSCRRWAGAIGKTRAIGLW